MKWTSFGCAVLMASLAAILLYVFRANVWTLLAVALLLICPILVALLAWQQYRRTVRDVKDAVRDEFKRRAP